MSTGKPRPFITHPFRRSVFNMIHNLNHPSIRSTFKSLSARFVWPLMKKDCTAWAKSCIPCQTSKVTRHVHSPLGTYLQPTDRFSHIRIDLIGPLPPVNSFKYCLTIIDRFTRWPEVYPLQDASKESVCTGLITAWISRFGCPNILTADRGGQFRSHMFTDFCKVFGVKLRLISSWHPKSNGIIEILHRNLKASINIQRALINNFKRIGLWQTTPSAKRIF